MNPRRPEFLPPSNWSIVERNCSHLENIPFNLHLVGRNYIPGRPDQKKNDWANQPGVSVYLHPDKKSTIPIPVKADASAAPNPGSFPLQMRRNSPNMKIGAVVPHQAEFGEFYYQERAPYLDEILQFIKLTHLLTLMSICTEASTDGTSFGLLFL